MATARAVMAHSRIHYVDSDRHSPACESCGHELRVEWFGAYDADPGNLVFWLFTETEEVRQQIERDQEFWAKLRSFFVQYRYPAAGRDTVFFGVESRKSPNASAHGGMLLGSLAVPNSPRRPGMSVRQNLAAEHSKDGLHGRD
jgi:hypothetical protein